MPLGKYEKKWNTIIKQINANVLLISVISTRICRELGKVTRVSPMHTLQSYLGNISEIKIRNRGSISSCKEWGRRDSCGCDSSKQQQSLFWRWNCLVSELWEWVAKSTHDKNVQTKYTCINKSNKIGKIWVRWILR